ncbi:ABC transporter permease [Spirochaetia bacterium]|nr:ABC transporter permease [Spirochaetia bacterium]
MKKNRRIDMVDLIILIFLGLISIISIFPFYQTVILSFSKMSDVGTQKIFLFPVSFDLSSYDYLIKEGKMMRGIGVTLIVTLAGTLLSMVVTISGAYALTKKTMPGRNFIFDAIILTMFFSGGLVPYFLTIRSLGLINKIWVMIIPVAVNTFNLILMKNFLAAIPAELEESARIDGANDIVVLIRIIVPVSKPIIATIALFYAVDRWNEWWNAMIFINDTKLYPLQLVLREAIININAMLRDGMGVDFAARTRTFYQDSVKAAIIIISAVPILLVYPFLQKYFAQGIMIGSIKG